MADRPGPRTTAPTAALSTVLAAAAEAGDYFRLPVLPTAPATGERWRPFAELVDDPEVLAERVAAGRELLARTAAAPVAAVELRAAASVVFLGLAARLVAAPIGAAVLGGAVPLLQVRQLRWQTGEHGVTRLAVQADPDGPQLVQGRDPEQMAELIGRVVLEGPVAALLQGFRVAWRISPRLLRGNVASGVGGAVTVLAAVAPRQAGVADAVGRALLARPPLAGCTRPLPPPLPDRAVGWPPRRLSCCLYYRLPAAGLCADCVLDRVPVPADRPG